MELRLSERYITALNFLLIAIIAYFLAQSVSGAVQLHLAGSQPTGLEDAAAHPSPARHASGLLPRTAYHEIVRRDIFERAPAANAAPVANETLNVTLIGTSHLSRGRPFIIVADSDGNQSLYRLGENIPNTGHVLAIGRDRAVILHDGRRVALTIPNEEQDELPQQVPPASRGSYLRSPMRPEAPFRTSDLRGVQRLSATRYVVARSTVNQNLHNMASLFTQIRAIPNLRNGSSNGFRLSEIQPGSIFDQIGLEDGDVVTAAQGQSVSDPMKAMELLRALRNGSSITLNVIRDGAPMLIHYSIR